METKIRYLTILLACLLIGLAATWGIAQRVEKRPSISDAERALAMLEVQNTFSKHGHRTSNIEELNTIWVSPNGPYGKTAHWANPNGIWEGMDLVMLYYGTGNRDNQRSTLEAINKLYPEIKVVPENYGIGGLGGFNNPTNPVIEIAGDGKTAKGIWKSNGPAMSSSVVDGKLEVRGNWYWRTYMVDFAKEDGQWKIWHMNIVYDMASPLDAEYGMDYTKYKAPEKSGGGSSSLPGPNRPNHDPYKQWSPLRPPQTQIKVPEPYYTFSETFSY